MAWLSSSAPRERRTELVATAFGAALGGALLGPVVGALARSAGTGATFTGVAAIASGLLVFTLRENAATRGDVMPSDVAGGFTQAFRQPLIVGGAWLVGMSALMFGVLDVLLPLKMGRLGASGALIAAVFLAAAAVEAVISRPVGRYVDRRRWMPVARVGLVGTAAVALVASFPDTVGLLAAVGFVAGPLAGILWIPGFALLSQGADRAGIDHSYAFAVQNLMWAGAQMIGSGAGGALAGATTDFVPYALVAAVAVATLAAVPRLARLSA
jgi:MFS family permease